MICLVDLEVPVENVFARLMFDVIKSGSSVFTLSSDLSDQPKFIFQTRNLLSVHSDVESTVKEHLNLPNADALAAFGK